jgi:hypothetical protein
VRSGLNQKIVILAHAGIHFDSVTRAFITRVDREIRKALQTPEVAERLRAFGY